VTSQGPTLHDAVRMAGFPLTNFILNNDGLSGCTGAAADRVRITVILGYLLDNGLITLGGPEAWEQYLPARVEGDTLTTCERALADARAELRRINSWAADQPKFGK